MPLKGAYEPGTSASARGRVDRYEATDGIDGGVIGGRPVILLISRGATTGRLRKTPLMRVERDGDYAVVGSLGGSARDPSWCHNLRADTHAELQDGPMRRDYTAREVAGDERAVWWERAVAAFPEYARFQRKTTRQIPVFVLEPLDPAPSRDAK